jgi:hypothetical protein
MPPAPKSHAESLRPLRPTSLLGSRAPTRQGAEIVLAVLTGTGEWALLAATPQVWADICAWVSPAAPAPAAAAESSPARPTARQRTGRRGLSPARREVYVAAARDYLAGRWPSWRACARAFGVGHAALQNWYCKHKAEVAAAPAPVLKPGGKIL